MGSPGAGRLERAIGAVERNAAWALAGLMLLSGALLLYMGRGLSFFYDDWDFVIHDYGGGLHSLLLAHVGNISVFPVAVYKVLFHLVGLNHYAVFRLVVIVLHLICGALVYVLAARRMRACPRAACRDPGAVPRRGLGRPAVGFSGRLHALDHRRARGVGAARTRGPPQRDRARWSV